MNIISKQRRCVTYGIFAIILLIVNVIGSFGSCGRNINGISYVKEKDAFFPQSSCEEAFIGDVITKNVYGLKITAVYKETKHYPTKDIVERKYTVTNVERDGVCEKVSEDNYISIDANGNICELSLEHIMDTEIKAYEKMHKSVKNGQLKKTPSYGRIEIYLP